ncbi:MAG TPA: stalk domain-containing protein [Caldisericia bacterium]|nr:stalk domain-containing protein [Caldisericia bacterium]HQJ43722.1 stalk domain-containing protein [Caldisericia bacterium]
MKKTISILIATLMLMTVLPVFGNASMARAENSNANGVFVAVRFEASGWRFSGNSHVTMPNQEIIWGRPPQYPMPANIHAWTEFYLDVVPAAGMSTESNHWYAVIDTDGNLWFDSDGNFHDCRYYKYADPEDPDYGTDAASTIDNCQTNPHARFDPTSANNTQGPYQVPRGNNISGATITPFGEGANPTYFMDPKTGRTFRIGIADLVARNSGVVGTSWINPATGNPLVSNPAPEWDQGMALERFLDGYGPGAPPVPPAEPVPNVYYNIGGYFYLNNLDSWNFGEEWHAVNATGNREMGPFDGIHDNQQTYVEGDWIYRRGANGANNLVSGYDYTQTGAGGQASFPHYYGDTRLVPVVTQNVLGRVIRYPAGSAVRDRAPFSTRDAGDDFDVGTPCYRFPLSDTNFSAFGNPPVSLSGNAWPGSTVGDTVHLQLTWGVNGMFDYTTVISPSGTISIAEGIYEKGLDGMRANTVEQYDLRLSHWSTGAEAFLTNPTAYIQPGDALIMSEVLTGGCASPVYNISIETDLWQGVVPSKTMAAIRTPNGEVTFQAQNIQKATVLGPNSQTFAVPACSFENIKLDYREYLGVEIWYDDGVDNNIGADGVNRCLPNNGSDDYVPGSVGELFLGCQDNIADTDIGLGMDAIFGRVTDQAVLPMSDFYQQDPVGNPNFGAPVRFFDTNNAQGGGYGIINYYGCGEALYRDIDYLLAATTGGLGAFEISPGDVRLSDVTVVRRDPITGAQTIISYEAGSTVAQGDADVNLRPGTGPNVLYHPGVVADYVGGNDLSAFYDKYYDIQEYNAYVAGWSFPNPYEPVFLDWKHLDPSDATKWIPLNNQYDLGEFIYDAGPNIETNGWTYAGSIVTAYGNVQDGFIRLTNVSYAGQYYKCGTVCSIYDQWRTNAPVYGITFGNNGDKRFMDMEVIPGSAGATMTVSKPFQVEQTSHVKITLDPAPKAGHWDGNTWIPDERGYVLFQGIGKYEMGKGEPRNLNNMLFEITPNRPTAEFEFTPYRGSCDETGRADRPGSSYGLITTYVIRDNGGQRPAPPDGYYGDYFWDLHGMSSNQFVGKTFKERVKGRFVPWAQDNFYYPEGNLPYPPLPADLQNNYDCFDVFYDKVNPEKLVLTANRLCITTLDQRFPNVSIKLTDADNENDVNDPAGVPFSIPFDLTARQYEGFHANIVNYNCNGGGIAWMAVAVPANTSAQHKFIVQYNTDGTYYYWYWYEPPQNPIDTQYPQVPWALDPNDYLLGEEYTGTFPIPNTTAIKKTPVFVDNRVSLEDIDCSQGTGNCDVCEVPGLRKLGDITGYVGYPLRSDRIGIFDGTFGYIVKYGVPTYVTGYGQVTPSDTGGECLLAVKPKDGSTHLNIRIYSNMTTFDYNSTIAHPAITNGGPFFVYDKMINGSYHEGIDYCGTLDMKVYPPDPYVNFAEFTIVDHALQFSDVHYTAGTTTARYLGPLSPLNIPTPQIQAPYDPILRYVSTEFRCYPGGQTHAGRVTGQVWGGRGGPFGWNAYPAIWSKKMNERLTNEQFGKLGTEFFPLTDYGFYFIVKDGEGRHLSFNPDWEIDRRMVRMEIVGPFARPKVIDRTTGSVTTQYEYNGLKQVPISYDWTGKIVIDQTNYKDFEYQEVRADWNGDAGSDPFTPYQGIPNENRQYRKSNDLIKKLHNLNFSSVGYGTPVGPGMVENTDNVIVVDELIPWQPGKILIYVTLADGTFKMYQDCCTAPPVDGVDVHALGINYVISDDPAIRNAPLGIDNKVEVTLSENQPIQTNKECNDAVVYIWQDRGVQRAGKDLMFGAGDGWITNPPGSTRFYYGRSDGSSSQYDTTWDNEPIDVNGDSKVTFKDWETEICGSYDMATNTWNAGIIDARTFQRNNGIYVFELTDSNRCRVETSGLDFGGEEGIGDPPDHIISDKELLPLYVTAYKYGDDNNDRAFSPFWDPSPMQDTYQQSNPSANRMRYSHEVYLAGQIAIPVEPLDDLIVTVASPKLLTAGITPELISPDTPLTFEVKNAEGGNVDLSQGIKDVYNENLVKEDHIWNYLFKDPYIDDFYYYGPGSSLPQYFFVRTNLHNRDLGVDNNEELFSVRTLNTSTCDETISIPFRPIKVDFSQAKNGKYIFRGFCANDVTTWKGEEGSPDEEKWLKDHQFIVHVYTPDRKHRGTVVVPIESPKVSYEIVNAEDPNLTFYSSPGDPDFVMTAGDNRMYKIRVTITDAEGRLVKGVTKGVSVCGGGVKNTARFTPFVTRPDSFDFDFNPCQGTPCGTKIYPHVGFDFDASEKKDGITNAIDPGNKELYQFGGFTLNTRLEYQKCRDRVESGYVEYNSTCYWYRDKNEWEVDYVNPKDPTLKGWAINKRIPPNLEFSLTGASEPLARGWGLGNIYNYPYWGGALFADIDSNGELDYHDALGLDVNAQTEFFLFAEDACFVGGLVGSNTYVNSRNEADVAGYPPRFRTDPREIQRRFKYTVSNDQTFYLDWEAWPDHVAQVAPPKVKVLDASTGNREEIGKEFLNGDNYDLIYNWANQLICEIRPADERDVPMHPDGYIMMVGNQHEQAVYGRTKPSAEDEKVMETTIEFTPTGLGEATINMFYLQKNKYFCAGSDVCNQVIKMVKPEFYGVKVQKFDVGKGLEITAETIEDLTPKANGKIFITVKEYGAGAPVAGAKVKVSGLGVDQTKTTNGKGEVEIEVAPNATGFLKIEATADNFKGSSTKIMVGSDKTPPMLEIDPVVPITNKDEVQITGTTESGSTVTINGKPATTKGDKFTGTAKLQNGKNTIVVVATDGSGNTTTKMVYVTLDKEGPAIMVDAVGENNTVYGKDSIKLKGRVDADSKVTVKDMSGAVVGEATVVHDMWILDNVKLAPAPSKNEFKIEATDLAGNTSSVMVTITNIDRVIMTLKQGDVNAMVGNTPNALPLAPKGTEFSTPVDFIKLLGGTVDFNPATNTVQIQINSHTLIATIGSNKVQIDGNEKTIQSAPTLSGSLVVVPAVDICAKMGLVTQVNDADKTVMIILDRKP